MICSLNSSAVSPYSPFPLSDICLASYLSLCLDRLTDSQLSAKLPISNA